MSTPPPPLLVKPDRRRLERLRALLPEVWALVLGRRGVLALGMVLIAVSRVSGLVAPLATKVLIDDVLGKRRLEVLPWLAAGVGLATLVQAGTALALTRIFTRSTARFVTELRAKLHAHVLRLPLRYHDRSQSGALASRVMNDALGIQSLVGTPLLDFLGSLLTAAVAFVLMARWSAPLAALTIGCGVVAAAISGAQTGRLKPLAMERNDILADVHGRLIEALGGVRVLKAYRAEPREDDIFRAGLGRLVANTLKQVRLSSGLSFASTVTWGLVNAVILYVGARFVAAGRLTLGELFTITVLLNYLAAPLLQVVGIGALLMEALAGLERMRAILKERPEDQDPRRVTEIGALRGEVVFERVSFAYEPGKPVLHEVSFRAAPGTVTALVGPSGAGKSTTTGLVGSFYVPTSGAIHVDGLDLGTVRLDGYRAQLGVVLQETFLFAGSILDNIAFARPDAPRAEILAAARSARVDEFAEALDEVYETRIGERGVRLSGGQRQRISIARALLADPRILILDEATSSLDTTSEALIQEALGRLLVGRTTFVIAHRLSTIRRADQILVVDGGRVVERGTHASLLAAGGLYADMHRRQHDGEADLFLAPGEGAAPPEPSPAALAVPADEVSSLLPPSAPLPP